ncbi:carboxypeptidase regulatory-like domain-containing protein [candidate division KSB1 bacterium]|nr:carboxypeptidase regulatory-like domain-containing protein [candidate division KSB1 bacterium]
MARVLRIILMAVSAITVSAGYAAVSTPDARVGVPLFGDSPTPLGVSSPTPGLTTISLENPSVQMQEVTVDFQTYTSFGMAGEPWASVDGSPAVPQISRFYRIANTGGVDLVISNADYEILNDVDVLPFQWEEAAFGGLNRDEAVYSADQWYPEHVVEMSEPMILRDFRVVSVTLYPVQVNPATRQVRIYHSINVDLVGNENPAPNELLNPRRPSGNWVPLYNSVIVNLDDAALANATETPGSILIVSHNNSQATQWADSLARWKKRRGFDVTIDARSNWNVNTIRTAVQAAYANWDPPLEFVVIIGDPQWTFGITTDGGNYDHTYALGNIGDDLEDIGCGRLSGNSADQMATINAKIMAYERTPNMTDTQWYTKAFLYAGVANEIASNYTLMQWTAQQFRLNTGVQNCQVNWVNGHVDDNLVRTQLNGGVGYFFWRGSWLSQMETSLAGSCSNGTRLPIVMCVTCGANEFVSGLGIAESYLLAGTVSSLKGGVAAIGTSTSGTHAPPNGTFAGGLLYAITTQEIEHLGHALNAGKVWLPLTFGVGSSEAQSFTRWNNLMGDPSLSMWSRTPTVMSVTFESTIAVGTHSATFDVVDDQGIPVEDALVVLWKGTETYERGLTNAQGHLELPTSIQSAGDLLLTITKRDYVPYLATIACNAVDEHVALTSYTIDDDNSGGTSGNGNATLNPGETVDLPIYLKNYGGTATATGISAQLVSHNPKVTIATPSATYANLAPGDSALGSTAFRLVSSSTLLQDEVILLTLNVTAASGSTHSNFEIEAKSGRADFQTTQFTPSFAPGVTSQLRVTLHNGGVAELTGVTATLQSLSPFVAVDDDHGDYGTIAIGGNATNTADQFTLRANSLTFRGHVAPMLLLARTSNGHVDSVGFTVTVGNATVTDPTGPDVYGYYAYDNGDASYEMHPTFNYVDISAGLGTNLNINDIGEKTQVSQVWSAARALPFEFSYYGQVFDSITVCSNGWAAFGSQAWHDGFRDFPIPAQQAPNAMLAPYWDDLQTSGSGQGVWTYYDSTNHRYIIQWKAKGGSSFSTQLNFEIILFDEEFHPTFDGNGNILFQYQTVSLNLPGIGGEADGQTIGIQAPLGLIGLPICYQLAHTPGSATVANNRAILFSTQARNLLGDIQGTVRDAETNLPMPGVQITIDGQNYLGTSNAQGFYTIPDILIGSYTVRASYPRYNDGTVENVIIELDSLETVDFIMVHPEFALSRDTVRVSIPSQPSATTFQIINDGNGPLDYALNITYAGDVNPDPWNLLLDDVIEVTGSTGDHLILGCEFVGDFWWISGGNGPDGDNLLYKYNLNGDLVGTLEQPTSSAYGWFDVCWDGNYLYGSDDDNLTGIDLTSGQVMNQIPIPLSPARAIAFDPATQTFWIADYTHDLFKVNRQGQILQQVANAEGPNQLAITGMTWRADDPDGYKLYIFSQNGAGSQTRVTRMNTQTLARQTVIDLEANPGDRSGGCAMTGGWNSTLLVFGAILQNSTGDRLGLFEVDFNTTWIDVTPTATTIPGGTSQTVNVVFDGAQLRPFVYRVNINMHSDVLDTTYSLPVVLTVEETAAEDGPPALITEYRLFQNYPNPFNPSTSIRYDLKAAGHTTLAVYNVNGQQVATLIDGVQEAGAHSVHFDGADLASGVYFYRLESADFVRVSKMVLMK